MKKITLFFSIFISISSSAFTLGSSTNSNLRGWSKKNLVYQLNSQNCPTNVRFNLEAAMALWNSVGSSQITLELSPTESTDSTAQVLANSFSADALIICETNIAGYGVDANSLAGFARFNYNGNNEIYKAYLVLNVQPGASANISAMNDYLVQVIMAHELGHTLGLGHSSDISALMYFSSTYKQNLALSQDDIEGISYLYPRDETGGDQLMAGCARVNSDNSSGPFSKVILFCLCLLPLFIILTKRKKSLSQPHLLG